MRQTGGNLGPYSPKSLQTSPFACNIVPNGLSRLVGRNKCMMNEKLPVVVHEALKPQVRAWFEALRDRICDAFEAIEDAQ